jgi:hypothetical protein
VQSLDARWFPQQALDALTPQRRFRIVHAAAQAPVQRLSPEDADPIGQAVRIAVEQQVAPGLAVERRARLKPHETLQLGDIEGREGIDGRLGLARREPVQESDDRRQPGTGQVGEAQLHANQDSSCWQNFKPCPQVSVPKTARTRRTAHPWRVFPMKSRTCPLT